MHFREEHSDLKDAKQTSVDTKSFRTLFFYNQFYFLRVFFNFTSGSGLSNKCLVINNFKKSLQYFYLPINTQRKVASGHND